jgi:hypothetical protein
VGASIDSRLLKVGGLLVAAVAGLAVVIAQTPGIELAATFGGGPTGIALAVVAVVVGIAGWIALEVSAGEAFAD